MQFNTNIMRYFTLSAFCCLLFVFCQKDKQTPCEQLEDTWRCTSWMEAGAQQLGSGGKVNDLTIRLEALDGLKGDFSWNALYSSGSAEIFSGSYLVDTNCTEVKFTPTAQTSFTLQFKVQKKDLTLSGDLNGKAVDIRLEAQ